MILTVITWWNYWKMAEKCVAKKKQQLTHKRATTWPKYSCAQKRFQQRMFLQAINQKTLAALNFNKQFFIFNYLYFYKNSFTFVVRNKKKMFNFSNCNIWPFCFTSFNCVLKLSFFLYFLKKKTENIFKKKINNCVKKKTIKME